MGAPKQTIEFCSKFKGHNTFVGATKNAIFSNYPGNLADQYDLLKQVNSLGHSIYFTVNETSDSGRKATDLESIRAIYADDDTPRKRPLNFPLKPNLIVRTSTHGKKHKHQYYWLTKTLDHEAWGRVMQGIISTYKTDPGAKDLARILRVPGFLNHKYNPPSKCTLLLSQGKPYKWSKILKKFPPAKKQKAPSKLNGSSELFNEHELFKKFLSGESITPTMNSLIAHWGHHYSSDNIRTKLSALFNEIPEDTKDEHGSRYTLAYDQIDKFIGTIKKKVNAERSDTETRFQLPELIKKEDPSNTPTELVWDWSVLRSNNIPEGVIPDVMMRAAKEIGNWTGVGPDPAVLSAVFITSAMLSKNILIHEIENDLTTHCQSGVCIVMDTGARKSSIYNQMNKPFFEFEDELKAKWEEDKYLNSSMHKTLTNKLALIRKKFDSKSHTENEFMLHVRDCAVIEEEIDKIQLQEPWLRSSDVTEEKLVRKLYHNQGVMAVISDDARQVINNIKGKYTKNTSGDIAGESVYINALTGSDILYERVGNEKDMHIKKPVLNALLFIQPDAALGLKNSEMFVPSGLAARLPMYFYPVSGADIVGSTKRRTINAKEMKPYYKRLRKLKHRRIENPLHIILNDEAMEVCSELDKKFAHLLNTTWRGHYDKSNKLITLSLMYACCFAAIEDDNFIKAYRKNKELYSIPPKYLYSGFEFAKVLFGQSIISHDQIRYESIPRKAESFLKAVQKWYEQGKVWEGFTLCGSLSNSVSASLRENLTDIVDMLLEKKWLVTTKMQDDKRKLNSGFPDKLVVPGELIFHLNLDGISKMNKINEAENNA